MVPRNYKVKEPNRLLFFPGRMKAGTSFGVGLVSNEEVGGRVWAQRDDGKLVVLLGDLVDQKPGWGHMECLRGPMRGLG